MKRAFLITIAILSVALMAGGALAADTPAPKAWKQYGRPGGQKLVLKDMKDKISYSIGLNIGKDFKENGMDIDADILAQGIRDVMAGGELLMNDQEIQETLMAFQQEAVAKQQEKMNALATENLKAGEAFLAENSKKEGVVTLPSGLQYKIVTEGAGKSPAAEDTVTVNYRGTLVDGTEFDSSYKRGEPATFPVNGVIAGWTEALQLMKEGAKWELFIPSSLAYGERGAGRVIGPNSALVFEVELLKVQ
ncbi:outer membrane protein MIP [Desulfuromonas versatilis]|uniref:Peptidyl-prolyl cis-trans isomerase n=1 Tax=Desulfuromonas versatilis TaxID=2802975 RepID=A0ABM8HMZ3_9BACT|nr:FKBP-type peptidyl-prolyl cis-trans isomerase [Desulfuromonas versatilis]BCR03822.1 outer membrane protein MIP [Desulfuromonas versatilis]